MEGNHMMGACGNSSQASAHVSLGIDEHAMVGKTLDHVPLPACACCSQRSDSARPSGA